MPFAPHRAAGRLPLLLLVAVAAVGMLVTARAVLAAPAGPAPDVAVALVSALAASALALGSRSPAAIVASRVARRRSEASQSRRSVPCTIRFGRLKA